MIENKNLESITIMAAAVSDFYIPEEKLSTHKIQSGENEDGLTIALEPVPKKLKKFTEEWNPLTIMVEFCWRILLFHCYVYLNIS